MELGRENWTDVFRQPNSPNKLMKQYKIGDIHRWQGIKNCDTNTFESGWLWIVTEVKDGRASRRKGIRIVAKNRSEAIKKYLAK